MGCSTSRNGTVLDPTSRLAPTVTPKFAEQCGSPNEISSASTGLSCGSPLKGSISNRTTVWRSPVEPYSSQRRRRNEMLMQIRQGSRHSHHHRSSHLPKPPQEISGTVKVHSSNSEYDRSEYGYLDNRGETARSLCKQACHQSESTSRPQTFRRGSRRPSTRH
ncbi:hypothetical protein FOL47_009200 [Perkinsus chesapeaki]|uniref:Uncharacterized protein n=1 Tax=Perkinsus chesapeaki TaxID=330153 RepID=A0A7J6L9W0_PERCH|nr:hypothetical protein FOL47_009200 [Perkinsus chesapeaki]